MTEQKVLDEARQADELRQLLRGVLPILRAAIFVNYEQTKAADELYDRIKKAVGECKSYSAPCDTEEQAQEAWNRRVKK